MDIEFYDLNRECVYRLPSSSVGRGYISANVTESFQKVGSFEITFIDPKLTALLASYPNGMFIIWNGFEGFLTDYQITDKKTKIFGTCLKGLLSKLVVKPYYNGNPLTAKPSAHMQYAFAPIVNRANWITYDILQSDFPDSIKMTVNKLITASDYMQQICERLGIGYAVFWGTDGKLRVKLVKRGSNGLILSQNNKNAEDVQVDFDLKTFASGGFFENKSNNTTSIDSVGTLATTIDKRECIFDTDNANDALSKLTEKTTTMTIKCKANRIVFNDDYKLGDVVRIQTDDGTLFTRQVVTSVQRWHEGSAYHEEPSFESIDAITKTED